MSKVLLAPDHAKAFGIALVVFGHTLRGLFSSGIIPQTEFWTAVDATIYLFHMPLFFYISGLFVQSSIQQHGYASFMKRAFYLLIIPMIIWSYLQFSLQYMAGSYSNASPDLAGLLTAPFPPRQQFWFLGSLFIMMALTGYLIGRGMLQKILWPLTIALFLIQIVIWDDAVAYMDGKPWAHLLLSTLLFWPYFLLAIAFNHEKMDRFKGGTFLCLFGFLGALTIYQFAEPLRAFLAILCVLSIYKIALNSEKNTSKENRIAGIIAFIGMNSMMIYLVHIIFSAGMRALLGRLGIEDGNLHLAAGFAIGMIGPLMLVPIGILVTKYFPVLGRSIFPVRLQRK